MFILAFQYILEQILDILYFPFWWYSKGIIISFRFLLNRIKILNQTLGLSIWVRNWLKPMYGQYDYVGYLISIFIRTVQIIFRFIALIFMIVIYIFLFFIWVLGPILIVSIILYSYFI